MENLPATFGGLATLALLLGLKHGFDADHLAVIDGLTRLNSGERRRHARWCGALFSLGHGLVVILVALLVGSLFDRWDTPAWLEATGLVISIAFLALLGVLNLRAVAVAAPHEIVRPVGLKGRWAGPLGRARHPAAVALVGALFALSFDTMSQAALFAVAGSQFGGAAAAAALGVLFMTGMLVTDGLNGLWISRLISRSDETARVASRVMSLAIGSVSLLVALFATAKWLVPRLDAWTEGKELLFGAIVLGITTLAFVVASWLSRRRVSRLPHSTTQGAQ